MESLSQRVCALKNRLDLLEYTLKSKILQPELEEVHQISRELESMTEELGKVEVSASLPDQNPNPLMRLRLDGEIMYLNPAAQQLFGNISPGQNLRNTQVELLTRLQAGYAKGGNIQLEQKMGEQWFSFLGSPISADECINLFGMDISEHKQQEIGEELNTAQIELHHHTIQQREREYQQLIQDLHNGPLQELYGVAFNLAGLKNDVQSEDLKTRISYIQNMLEMPVSELRDFCNDFRPPTLAHFGLEYTLQKYIGDFITCHPDLKVCVDLIPDGKSLPENVRLALFRICQESLRNVAKHAHAQTVKIRFWMDTQAAFLEVKDDGKGFDVPQRWVFLAKEGHMGLVRMHELVDTVGGDLKVDSDPGEGTLVRVAIPLTEDEMIFL
jgi:signal transduction histidine kinase